MKKRVIAILALAVLMLSLLAACADKGVVTAEQAKKIVLEDLGVSEKDVTMHVHITEVEGVACYSIYVTINGKSLEYVIHSTSGEILSVGESAHSH